MKKDPSGSGRGKEKKAVSGRMKKSQPYSVQTQIWQTPETPSIWHDAGAKQNPGSLKI